MNRRAEQKARSHKAIVSAAARRVREQGIQGMGVAEVMGDAGLTHGGFYAHFKNKDALASEAMHEAAAFREPWTDDLDGRAPNERMNALVKRYLNRDHRDNKGEGCMFAALAAEVANGAPEHQKVFAEELKITLEDLAPLVGSGNSQPAADRATAFMSLCVGAILLSRAVDDVALSEKFLKTARDFMMDADENTWTMRMLAEKKKLKKLKKKAIREAQEREQELA